MCSEQDPLSLFKGFQIHNLQHNTIMQSVLGGSLHKKNTSYLLLGLYHVSVNRISIVLMQITPQDERYYGTCASSEWAYLVFHKERLEPRVLPWQQHRRCHSVSFVMYISGAKFQEHCSNTSGDILDSVFYCSSNTIIYDVITFLICIIQKHKYP